MEFLAALEHRRLSDMKYKRMLYTELKKAKKDRKYKRLLDR